jgi:uncharacterized protein (DUF1330 family)
MSTVDPTGSDLKRFLADDPGGPVTMLNLLRFKPDGGRESYNKYAKAIVPFLERVGGTVLYLGDTGTPLVQPDAGNDWDAVLLVTYPSRGAFSQMVADPEYQRITHLRTEALDAAVLQPTTAKRG